MRCGAVQCTAPQEQVQQLVGETGFVGIRATVPEEPGTGAPSYASPFRGRMAPSTVRVLVTPASGMNRVRS